MKNNIRMPDDEVFIDLDMENTSMVHAGMIHLLTQYVAKTNYGRFFQKSMVSVDGKELKESKWEEIELPSLTEKEEEKIEETRES